tara:strand:+ start:170 stop:652 length:483 start_codon:yes stop_codon:yes gene_type:complete
VRILSYKILFFFIFGLSELRSKDFALIHSTSFSNLLVKTAFDNNTKQKGLMNIKQLKTYNGMLFIYDTPQIVNFWMYNTLIPLDIIFIDDKNIISSIKEGIPMEKNLITSDIKISAVLEIPRGCAKKLKVKKGQIVSWIIKKAAEIKNIRYFHCLNLKEK